ncbi:ABC transporter ATP-binding protein [Planococcus sp. A6]|uniref:ABC transporter ATP-binding protein n=1 Tax=Planococcus sp. A6 TaxID=2992760 RepID=UPI00237B5A37|nr:ABC transporter ATP-binding protein [Planococcus sp. A6]MDE0582503.1 ABC transporter ATP-binding protein [Planococcus sp. A6]
MTEMQETILEVKDLKTYFYTKRGVSKAVDGIDFSLKKGETLGIVGESGCGKSITSLSILRLIPTPPGKIEGGEVLFKGRDLVSLPDSEMRKIRGNEISMIFQEPMTSLNPVIPVGEQIAEAIRLHQKMNKKEARAKAVDMLKLVGIPSPEKRAKQEPFQLSGGMRQRVMIAMALSCNPEVLIADEPTTALDVTIQAQILELIKDLQVKLGMGVVLITHDLGVVAETCNKVAVMYAGNIVEHAPTQNLFDDPKHPYTRGLLDSLPKIDEDKDELYTIEGSVPSSYNMPAGCRFSSRCPFAESICEQKKPELLEQQDGSKVRCWMYSDEWTAAKPHKEVLSS